MSDTNQEFPYKVLGRRLKVMREQLRESLAEVAGSVEIEVGALSRFEHGTDRPSEDILLLLISHFAIKEEEATKLWELAGYEPINATDEALADSLEGFTKQPVIVMPIDSRVIYTDMSHVMVNKQGLVINFMQTGGPNGQPMIASRLGMSKDHAKELLGILQNALNNEVANSPRLLQQPANDNELSEDQKANN